MATIKHTLAADLFISTDELVNDTGLGYSNTTNRSVLNVTTSSVALNRKFFDVGTSDGHQLSLALNIDDFELAADNSRSMEVHFLARFGSGSSVGSKEIFLLLQPIKGQTGGSVIVRTDTTADGTSNRGHDVIVSGGAVGEGGLTSYVFEPGAFAYCVVRIKSATGDGVADGAYEYWINGNLESSAYDFDWDQADFNWEGSGKEGVLTFGGIAGSNFYMTNLALFDGWTTAEGVRPDFIEVKDFQFVSAEGNDYKTNTGGTSISTDRLNDTSASTALVSDVAGAELSLTLLELGVLGVEVDFTALQFRGQMSRANLDDNTITVELVNIVSSDVVATFDRELAQVTTVRERINQFFEIDETLKLSEHKIVIRNGV